MQIENVKIQNFKGIESLGVELGGRSVFVVGGNAAGKTSFISAIYCALTGKNMPPNPIKGNARTGKIEVELDGYAIELEFKKKGKKIEKKLSLFSTEDGEKLDSPRAKLDQIIGNLEFDPFEFMRMQPTPQLNYFCKVFGIKGITALNDDIKELNEVMTFDKKRLISVKDQCDVYDAELAKQEPVDVSTLSTQYQEGVDHNAKIEKFKLTVSDLKTRKEELERELAEVSEKIVKGDQWLASKSLTDTDAIKAQLDTASESSAAITEARHQKALHDEADAIEAGIDEAKLEKEKKAKAKKALIVKHTKAIKGFAYDDELGFTLDGLPFHVDQNNTAAQIVAGLKLGAGLLGDVKIARFEGSLLDQENLDAVSEFAQAEGLQLFVELVDRNEKDLRLEFVEDETPKTAKK